MNAKQCEQQFIELVQELKNNKKIRVTTAQYPEPPDETALQAFSHLQLPRPLHHFVAALSGLQLHWENAVQDTTLIEGNLHLLPLAQIAQPWANTPYLESDTNEQLKNFYPVDFFVAEACCGVYTGDAEGHLHFYAFNGTEPPYNLGIGAENYLRLAFEARCYHYWPHILQLITEKINSPLIQRFNNDMAVLFPTFSVEKFVNRYQDMKRK